MKTYLGIVASAVFLTHIPVVKADVAACSLSSKVIHSNVIKRGAKNELEELYNGKSDEWDSLLDCIATGDTAWLNIASLFRPVSDAGTAEGLDISVSEALVKQPINVLTVLGPELSKWNFCTMLDYNNPAFSDEKAIDNEYSRRLQAIKKIQDPNLMQYVTTCEYQINQARSKGSSPGT